MQCNGGEFSRALHLLTLTLHVAHQAPLKEQPVPASMSVEKNLNEQLTNKPPVQSLVDSPIIDISIPDKSNQIKNELSNFFLEKFCLPPSMDCPSSSSKSPISIGPYSAKKLQSDHILQDEENVPHLLCTLIDLQESMDAVHDSQHKNWLLWIINKCGALNNASHSYVLNRIKGKEDQKRYSILEFVITAYALYPLYMVVYAICRDCVFTRCIW
jgi:hypothetical protein